MILEATASYAPAQTFRITLQKPKTLKDMKDHAPGTKPPTHSFVAETDRRWYGSVKQKPRQSNEEAE